MYYPAYLENFSLSRHNVRMKVMGQKSPTEAFRYSRLSRIFFTL